MASMVEKRTIMQTKGELMYDRPTIEPYKIIRIINTAWSKSFARINSNKKVISERDWLPYNHALMLYPTIQASITDKETELEL